MEHFLFTACTPSLYRRASVSPAERNGMVYMNHVGERDRKRFAADLRPLRAIIMPRSMSPTHAWVVRRIDFGQMPV